MTITATTITTTARPRNTNRCVRLMGASVGGARASWPRRAASARDGEHAPLAHAPVERYGHRPALGEAPARPRDEVVDGRGGQHLARPRGRGEAGGDLQRGAAQPA